MMRSRLSTPELTIGRKLISINWLLVVLISLVAMVGFAMLYSAADGNMWPWAERQVVRFGVALVVMVIFYLFSVRYLHGPSLTWQGVFGTRAVLIGVATVVVAQLAFTYLPLFKVVFDSRPVTASGGAAIIGVRAAINISYNN